MINKALNKLHYCIYIIECKAHLLFNKINPTILLFKIPFIRKKFKDNQGIDKPVEWFNDFWLNKETGFGLIFTGGWLVAIVFILLFSLMKIVFNLVNLDELLNEYYFIALGILSYLICYFIVFKEDKYLVYFDSFKYWTKREKITNVLYTIFFIVCITALSFGSLILF